MSGLKLKYEKRGIQMENKVKFYQKTWFMWVTLVIFAPVGIALMWIYHKKYSNSVKIILSIVFGTFFIIVLLVDEPPKPDQINLTEYTQSPVQKASIPNSTIKPTENVTPIPSKPNSTPKSTSVAKPTVKPTESIVPTPFKTKVTKEPTYETELSSFQLISMEGHPVLYDYLSEAHTFWDKHSDGRIDFNDDYFDDYQQGKTVLVIDTYSALEHNLKEHMIRSFEVYPDEKITLKDGLKLAKSYLPLDIMKKWYYLENSEYYYTKGSKLRSYFTLYEPTKKGEKAIKKLGLDYNYVAIFIETKNNVVKSININSVYNVPRDLDYDKCKKWSYDFLK